MSHTARIQAPQVRSIPLAQSQGVGYSIKNLEALKKASVKLGLEFREGKPTFNFHGAGFLQGKSTCIHAIGIPGVYSDEIGVVKKSEEAYDLEWGATGQLTAILGKNAENLIQAYSTQLVYAEVPFGWTGVEVKQPNGDIILEFTH